MLRKISGVFLAVVVLAAEQNRQVQAQVLFGSPVNLANVNGSDHDDDPTISQDELTLIFSARRSGSRGLWQSTRTGTDQPWEPATDLGPTLNAGYSRYPSISADGLTLYFSDGYLDAGSGSGFGRPRPGGLGGADVWVSTRESVDAAWSEPKNAAINTNRGEDSPVISADGLSLYFSSNRPGGLGGNDIYVSHRTSVDADWGEARNLSRLNSRADDYMGGLSSDGKLLFFDSDRSGGFGAGDVYMAVRPNTTAEFGEPVNAGGAINSTGWDFRGSPSANGSTLYFAQAGANRNDLWQVPMMAPQPAVISGASGVLSEDFDISLGADGSIVGVELPPGWMATNGGVVASNTTSQAYMPNGRTRQVKGSMDLLNGGLEGDSDRSLVTGVDSEGRGNELRWLTQTESAEVSSLRLKFDVESWGPTRGRGAEIGEAAFDVFIEMNDGEEFGEVTNLGRVSTGASLLKPESGEQFDGNAAANRIEFDTVLQGLDIPPDSQIMFRWKTATGEATSTSGWLFGLDNVSLELNPTPGDANGDRLVDFADFLILSSKYGSAGDWKDGDFDLDGLVQFTDFLLLAENYTGGPAAGASVPEPAAAALSVLGLLFVVSAARAPRDCVAH